jgi:hypothetical protein
LPRFILVSTLGIIARSNSGMAVVVSFDFTLILKILFMRSIYRAAYRLTSSSLSEAELRQCGHKLEIQVSEYADKTVNLRLSKFHQSGHPKTNTNLAPGVGLHLLSLLQEHCGE